MYAKLELLTRKRIFYLFLTLVPIILPPLTSSGLSYLLDLPNFSIYVANALFDYKVAYAHLMPALHLLIILAILFLLAFGRRVGPLFSLFVAANLLFSVYTQTTVPTEQYGRVILTEIFLWYLVVVVLWVWDAFVRKTNYSLKWQPRQWWLIPLAVIAFWDPDQAWDLSLTYFIYGYSPTAFCMLTPIYLGLIMFAFPNVNLPLVRIHSYLGLVIGFISLFISLVQTPSVGIYWIILHTPLIAVSLYSFLKAIRFRPTADQPA